MSRDYNLFRMDKYVVTFLFIYYIFSIGLYLFLSNFTHIQTVSNTSLLDCNKCLYSKCHSSHLIEFCQNIQNLNKDFYVKILNTMNSQDNEFSKTKQYLYVYAKKMEECIYTNRKSCAHEYCNDYCEYTFNPDSSVSRVNFLYDFNTSVPFYPVNVLDDYIFQTDVYSLISKIDACFLNQTQFSDIFFECSESENCLYYYLEASRNKCIRKISLKLHV